MSCSIKVLRGALEWVSGEMHTMVLAIQDVELAAAGRVFHNGVFVWP